WPIRPRPDRKSASPIAAPDRTGERLMRIRLVSYNLHKCRGSFGPFAPERNLDVIAQLGADIVALQEVDFRMGDRPEALPRPLIEARTGLVPMQHRRTSDQSLGWHGQTDRKSVV